MFCWTAIGNNSCLKNEWIVATKDFDLLAHIVGLRLRGSGWGIMISE